MTKILAREMGLRVACAGTYCKHDADWFRDEVEGFCDEILITDDHTQVGDMIARIEPSAIFGTQMERHIGKRLDIPCGVISSPVHIQNFPLGNNIQSFSDTYLNWKFISLANHSTLYYYLYYFENRLMK